MRRRRLFTSVFGDSTELGGATRSLRLRGHAHTLGRRGDVTGQLQVESSASGPARRQQIGRQQREAGRVEEEGRGHQAGGGVSRAGVGE